MARKTKGLMLMMCMITMSGRLRLLTLHSCQIYDSPAEAPILLWARSTYFDRYEHGVPVGVNNVVG